MTFLAKDSYDLRAVGPQPESMRPSAPLYGFGKGTRDQMDKVFLSHHAEKIKGNPDTPGPIYNVPSDLGQAQKFGFGTGPQRVYKNKPPYPDSSVDLIMHEVDSGYAKFKKPPAFYFGTEAKDCMKNAAITKGQAPTTTCTPGPAAYIPSMKGGGSGLEELPSYPFGIKTKIQELPSSTPLNVGPGKYKLQKAVGKQVLSTTQSLPMWGFQKAKRFPTSKPDLTVLEPKPKNQALGKQVLSRSRSAPSFGFGTASRDHRSKTGCYILPEDKGPANDKGEMHMYHPPIQQQKMIVKYSRPGMSFSVQGFN